MLCSSLLMQVRNALHFMQSYYWSITPFIALAGRLVSEADYGTFNQYLNRRKICTEPCIPLVALISTYLVSTFFSIYVPFPSEAIGTFLATLQYLVKKLRTFLMIGFLDRNSIERKGTHWYLPIVYLYRRQQTFLVPLCEKFCTYWVVYLFWDLLCTYSFYSVVWKSKRYSVQKS